MKNLDRMFVLTGLIFLLVGMALGLKMSATLDFTMRGLHAHLNLLGFVLMTLFGLCYRCWPNMQVGKLATVHYFLHTISVAIGLALLYVLFTMPEQGATIGPAMNIALGFSYLGILLFTYLAFTRAKD